MVRKYEQLINDFYIEYGCSPSIILMHPDEAIELKRYLIDNKIIYNNSNIPLDLITIIFEGIDVYESPQISIGEATCFLNKQFKKDKCFFK
jgi:hypothetical protein